MARTNIKDLPPEPKRNRRGSRDLYEAIALILWMLLLMSTLTLMFVSSGNLVYNDFEFTIEKFRELIYVAAGLWVLCSIALYLFDRNAVSIEKEDFEYKLKNFKELRDNIISLEKEKIEMEKKRLAEIPEIEE